ncbi:uncharacterized protein [Montipora foliosa]|uniref:uncharacterized protein n=1 Tax=Montipora foliosa TaxID=591990 RepID=UPI0035F1A6A2
MPETSGFLQTLRSAKFKKGLHIAAIVFGFLNIGGCFILASLTYILFGDCEDCSPNASDQEMVRNMRIFATVLFLLGILLIALSLCCKGPENSLAPTQVVISSIPAEDMEKTPAPVLGQNHAPHRPAFAEGESTNSPALRPTRTTVENVDETSNSSANAGFWTEDNDGPITPPPTYEEAIVMRWPVVVVREHGSQSSDEEAHSVDTGL